MIKWFLNLFKKSEYIEKKLPSGAPYLEVRNPKKPEPLKRPDGFKPKGFDISHHNGDVNFQMFADQEYDFVYLKSSEGTTFKDKMFSKNYAKADGAGILVGAYHFFHPDKDALSQFKNFAASIAPLTFEELDLIPCVDWEAHRGVPEQAQYDRLKEFCEIIEVNTGVRPLIYTGKWYVDQVDALSSAKRPGWLANYPLWLSWYSKKPVPQVAPWGNYTVLQWSGDVKIAELGNKPYDLNVMFGNSLSPILMKQRV